MLFLPSPRCFLQPHTILMTEEQKSFCCHQLERNVFSTVVFNPLNSSPVKEFALSVQCRCKKKMVLEQREKAKPKTARFKNISPHKQVSGIDSFEAGGHDSRRCKGKWGSTFFAKDIDMMVGNGFNAKLPPPPSLTFSQRVALCVCVFSFHLSAECHA